MKLGTLCTMAGLEAPSDTRAAECEITAVVHDTRTVVPGCLFVCIRGTKVDGHSFIEEAVKKGAAAVVTEREFHVNGRAVFFRVADTREALARLCDAWYGHPARGMKLIAVTGTNGKTSVSTMLKAMFDAALIPCGLIGTVRCVCRNRVLNIRSADASANMTTPDPEELYHMLAVMAREGCRVVIMEATSHALALRKLAPLSFGAAIFTNLTPEHLDFHKSMDAYFEAKASLFPRAKLAILNADDAASAKLIPYCKNCEKVIRTSCGEHKADYTAENVSFLGVGGVAYTVRSRRAMIRVESPIPGTFTVSNTLQAIACALELEIPVRCIRESLNTLTGVEGRMEKVKLGVPVDFSVFVDYAHTPDALENLLRTAQNFRAEHQRIVLLFGCGGDRDKSKRAQMGGIASRMCDMVYVTSDNSRGEDPGAIIADILTGIDKEKPYRVIPDRAVAIETAIREAQPGDIILLAGKGHERYEINACGKLPFDERQIAAAAAADAYAPGKRTDG